MMSNLHTEEWHTVKHTEQEEKRHYERIDAELAKKTRTHYIMGSLFWDFIPDAIVVIPDALLRKRVAQREDLTYSHVKSVENTLKAMAKKHKVRVFDSFRDASLYVLLQATRKKQ